MPSELFIQSFVPVSGMVVTLLGSRASIQWEKAGRGFKIIMPEAGLDPPHPYGWVFRIRGLTGFPEKNAGGAGASFQFPFIFTIHP